MDELRKPQKSREGLANAIAHVQWQDTSALEAMEIWIFFFIQALWSLFAF